MTKLSRSLIYLLIRSGDLRALTIRRAPGRRPIYRIEPDDLRRFMDKVHRDSQRRHAQIVAKVG